MEKIDLKNLKNTNLWLRLVFMIVFVMLYGVAEIVAVSVVIMQFLIVLFTNEKNEYLIKFAKGLSVYFYNILMYLSFNSDDKPFPFDKWKSDLDTFDKTDKKD